MNNRIDEIIEKIGCVKNVRGLYHNNKDWFSGVDLETFAELIIEECLVKIEVWEQDSRNHVSYLLKQHFGIEQ